MQKSSKVKITQIQSDVRWIRVGTIIAVLWQLWKSSEVINLRFSNHSGPQCEETCRDKSNKSKVCYHHGDTKCIGKHEKREKDKYREICDPDKITNTDKTPNCMEKQKCYPRTLKIEWITSGPIISVAHAEIRKIKVAERFNIWTKI